MDVDIASKGISVLYLHSTEPDDPRYNRIAARRINPDNLAGPATVLENRARGSAVSYFVRDLQFAKRRSKTSRPIADSELGGRNRIGGHEVSFLQKRQFLVVNAYHDVMIDVTRGGAGTEKNCERADENIRRDAADLAPKISTHDQIGRILVQLRSSRQRFLPKKFHGRGRFPRQPIGCRPARNVFPDAEPARDTGNRSRP